MYFFRHRFDLAQSAAWTWQRLGAAGGDGDCGVCGKALVISMGQWQKLYGSAHWRAKAQLRAEPLCRLCAVNGKVTPAQVADHIQRHEGDVNSF